MVKRIILLLDGTWNDIDAGPKDTNIVRMRGLISRHLVRMSSHGHSGDGGGGDKKVHGYTKSGKEHIVYYERGVGTGAFDRFRGGAFGEGLTQNIRHAYKFLSFWYEPGDEIFIYGFSRGAYTARSLVGYLGSAGLLLRDNCNEELEALAWRYYRTPPNDRMPADWRRLTDNAHDRAELRVKLLGVFDTVGSLGIPASIAWRLNRNENGFHDVELSSLTDVNLHAVAIDEHRWPFQATLWRQPPFKKSDTKVEQVWFSGAHSDVGGGYIDEEKRKRDAPYADNVTLDWMVRRTKRHYPDFPFDLDPERESDHGLEQGRTAQFPERRLLCLAVRRSIHRQCQDRGGLLPERGVARPTRPPYRRKNPYFRPSTPIAGPVGRCAGEAIQADEPGERPRGDRSDLRASRRWSRTACRGQQTEFRLAGR